MPRTPEQLAHTNAFDDAHELGMVRARLIQALANVDACLPFRELSPHIDIASQEIRKAYLALLDKIAKVRG